MGGLAPDALDVLVRTMARICENPYDRLFSMAMRDGPPRRSAASARRWPASSAGQPMRADTHLGQRVGGQADIRKVTAASLIDEAVSWGIRRRTASAVVTETLDQATPGYSPSSASRPSGSAGDDSASASLSLLAVRGIEAKPALGDQAEDVGSDADRVGGLGVSEGGGYQAIPVHRGSRPVNHVQDGRE